MKMNSYSFLSNMPYDLPCNPDAKRACEADPSLNYLCCPLSGELMQNPVIASDGHTYNYMSIMRLYLQCRRPLSPVTNEPLDLVDSLKPNWALRNEISKLISQKKKSKK